MHQRILIGTAAVLLLNLPVQAQPGFTTYLIGFLTDAAGQPRGGGNIQELRKSHIAHLDAMWTEGLLVASGSVDDTSELKSVLVFSGDQREQIEKRLGDSPLVKAGLLQVALGPWIAPVGIGDEHRKWAAANPGVSAKTRTYQLVLLKEVLGARLAPEEQRGLLLQMDAMAKGGTLAAAGPVLEGSDLAWIFVFSAAAAETDALTASNPAVKAGKILAERHPWVVPEGVLPPGFKVPLK